MKSVSLCALSSWFLFIVACPSTTQVPISKKGVGPQGGIIKGADGVLIEIPEGALGELTEISVEKVELSQPPESFRSTGSVYAFLPHGQTFAKPITVTLPYDPALVTGDPLRQQIMWASSTQGPWQPLSSSVQPQSHIVVTQTEHFSFGGVGEPGVDECSLGQDNCHQNAECQDTEDGFTCSCLPGYQGDGVLCTNVDECKLLDTMDSTLVNTCAIAEDGTMHCWGDWRSWLMVVPEGTFTNLSISRHGCAVRTDQTVVCWGQNTHGVVDAPAGLFQQVTTGNNHSCGLHLDGSVSCWGAGGPDDVSGTYPHFEQSSPPDDLFIKIAAGDDHTCGIKLDGTLKCWGAGRVDDGHPTSEGQAAPPDGNFVDIEAGTRFSCGLDTEGRVFCWGAEYVGTIVSPRPGRFVRIAASYMQVCAVSTRGEIDCWGRNSHGQLDAPPGRFINVSTGAYHACGAKADGTLLCWGAGESSDNNGTFPHHSQSIPPDMSVLSTRNNCHQAASCSDTEGGFQCQCQEGYTGDGVTCSNIDECSGGGNICGDHGQCQDTQGSYLCTCDDGYRSLGTSCVDINECRSTALVTTGEYFSCAIAENGSISCWGSLPVGSSATPQGSFTHISAGFRHVCGLRQDGRALCWGGGTRGELSAPLGDFQNISAGNQISCGILLSGQILCWGSDLLIDESPPSGAFTHVAVGYFHGCAIREDQTVACWGRGGDESPAPTEGAFVDLDVGSTHACALGTDATLTCWGRDNHGQASPPSGQYKDIATVGDLSCALTQRDASVICWGDTSLPQANTPQGAFEQIDLGTNHACGKRADGTIECWGNNAGRQLDIPEIFAQNAVHGCHVHAGCLNTEGGHLCQCDPGYQGDGFDCSNIDECSNETHSCDSNGTCVDIQGDYLCICAPGYESQGYNCLDVDECQLAIAECTDNSSCSNLEGGYECPCDAGYEPIGDSCQNIDECTRSLHNCHVNAGCSDSIGGYECACLQGYMGDGLVCDDLNECAFRGSLSAGVYHSCAIDQSGQIVCWGRWLSGSFSYSPAPPEGTFTQVVSKSNSICGLAADATVVCAQAVGQPEQPSSKFIKLAAGSGHVCGITTDRVLECWGDGSGEDNNGTMPHFSQSIPPSGTFRHIAAGFFHSCGIREDGRAVCWGAGESDDPVDGPIHWGQSIVPEPGPFIDIAASVYRTCAQRPDFSVVCWGRHGEEVEGTFSQITGACGLRPSGEIFCWVEGSLGRPPQGRFSQIAHGSAHGCAIGMDGQTLCWGERMEGATLVPDPLLAQTHYSCGDYSSCVDVEGGFACQSYASLEPDTHDFGVTPLNITSDGHTFTWTNNGSTDLTDCQVPTVGGAHPAEFLIVSDSCGDADLVAHSSCSVEVLAGPLELGIRQATLSRSCAQGVLSTVANGLSVTAVLAEMTVAPESYTFEDTVIGASTSSAVFTFRNSGNVSATHCEAPELTGAVADDFVIEQDNCGTSDLLAASSCTVHISALPSATGARVATLSRACSNTAAKTETEGIGVVGAPKVYVTNSASDSVSVIHGTTYQVIDTIGVGQAPKGIAVNNNDGRVYVANSGDGTLTVIDGINDEVKTVVPIGTGASSVVVNPVTNIVYVMWQNRVDAIDGTTSTSIGWYYPTMPVAAVGSFTNSSHYIVASHFPGKAQELDIVDVSGNRVHTVDDLYVTTASQMGFNSTSGKLYLPSGANSVAIVDQTSFDVTTVAVGGEPMAVAIALASNYAYVTNRLDNTVSVINGDGFTILTTIAVQQDPLGIAYDAYAKKVYVANESIGAAIGSVSVIDAEADLHQEIQAIDVGSRPYHVAVLQ